MASSALLIREIDARAKRGSMRRTAAAFKVPRERLYQIRNGSSVGVKTAARILSRVREEDLALADRIEAELVQSWVRDLREEMDRQ